MIEHYLLQREIAVARGDLGMVREINAALQRAGYVETAVDAVETATPPRPRGRPGKTRVPSDLERTTP